jgi:hypothetical protein
MLLTHSPSPLAGTSTTSSRGIGWENAGDEKKSRERDDWDQEA